MDMASRPPAASRLLRAQGARALQISLCPPYPPLVAARASAIHPGAAVGYELIAIASCIIGGASPSGGTGSIRTTVVGALIISVLRNGLTLLKIESSWQDIAVGLVIVFACALDVRRNSSN